MLLEGPHPWFLEDDRDEEHLPRIALVNVPHPQFPHLYQRCFEYREPWQWSPEVELVETGHWFFAPPPEGAAA